MKKKWVCRCRWQKLRYENTTDWARFATGRENYLIRFKIGRDYARYKLHTAKCKKESGKIKYGESCKITVDVKDDLSLEEILKRPLEEKNGNSH